jgi:hypothetical protein
MEVVIPHCLSASVERALFNIAIYDDIDIGKDVVQL